MENLEHAWVWVESIIRRYQTEIGGNAKVKPSPYAAYTGEDLAAYVRTKGYEARYVEADDYVEVTL